MANKTDTNSNIKIGMLLQQARELAGKTQADIESSTGMSKNHVSAIERGLSKGSIELLLGYSDCTGLSPNDILQISDSAVRSDLMVELSKLSDDEQKKILAIIKILKEENEQ